MVHLKYQSLAWWRQSINSHFNAADEALVALKELTGNRISAVQTITDNIRQNVVGNIKMARTKWGYREGEEGLFVREIR